jgi:hypothetical protein
VFRRWVPRGVSLVVGLDCDVWRKRLGEVHSREDTVGVGSPTRDEETWQVRRGVSTFPHLRQHPSI